MHIPDPIQVSRNMHLTNPRRRLSQRQRTGLSLAIAIVNSILPGTSVLDRLRQIIREREQQQQEQQRRIDATKSQKAPSPPKQDEEENVTFTRRDDFSPDRTSSPSPRPAEQPGSSDNSAVNRYQSWELREKQLENEIDVLRRWKLNHLLEVDRERLRDLETTDTRIYRCGQQKAAKKRKNLDTPLGFSQDLAGEGSGSDSETTLLYQQHEDSVELLEFKHRLLSHLEVVRLNQFFLEQVVTTEQKTIGRLEVPSLLWNVSMASNLIQAVKEATLMLCSPIIQSDLSEKAYLHTMDAVHLYMKEPYLTPRQYNNVLKELESSWEHILLPILSASSESHTEMSITPSLSALSIARFSVAAQHQTHQEHQEQYSEELSHQTRCLGGLLLILLRALAQTLDMIQQSSVRPDQEQQQQQQQQYQDQVSGGGECQFGRRTRRTGKAKTAGRVKLARRRMTDRQVLRQRQQQLEERCGQMVGVACGLLSAYRRSCSLMTKLMNGSQDSTNTDNYNRVSVGHIDVAELRRVEDDCDRLMGCICSKVLSSGNVSTTEVRPMRCGISVWLTERIYSLISIDCFQ